MPPSGECDRLRCRTLSTTNWPKIRTHELESIEGPELPAHIHTQSISLLARPTSDREREYRLKSINDRAKEGRCTRTNAKVHYGFGTSFKLLRSNVMHCSEVHVGTATQGQMKRAF